MNARNFFWAKHRGQRRGSTSKTRRLEDEEGEKAQGIILSHDGADAALLLLTPDGDHSSVGVVGDRCTETAGRAR